VDEARVRSALERGLDDPSFRGKAWLRAYLERKNSEGKPASMVGHLRGFLQGFIDAVFQVGEGDSARFIVCDYKTNDLAGTGALRAHTASWEPRAYSDGRPIRLRRWHYDQANLETGMDHHHYHLQALLYTVAVHRMLRQRLESYDYDRHVAGHAYLFVRGMEGEHTWRDPSGRTLGVWLDRWPRATVQGLSDALEGDS
jgi:exodeoxyribonuclease V beta subunit